MYVQVCEMHKYNSYVLVKKFLKTPIYFKSNVLLRCVSSLKELRFYCTKSKYCESEINKRLPIL